MLKSQKKQLEELGWGLMVSEEKIYRLETPDPYIFKTFSIESNGEIKYEDHGALKGNDNVYFTYKDIDEFLDNHQSVFDHNFDSILEKRNEKRSIETSSDDNDIEVKPSPAPLIDLVHKEEKMSDKEWLESLGWVFETHTALIQTAYHLPSMEMFKCLRTLSINRSSAIFKFTNISFNENNTFSYTFESLKEFLDNYNDVILNQYVKKIPESCGNCAHFEFRANGVAGKLGHCKNLDFNELVSSYCVNVVMTQDSFTQVAVKEKFCCKFYQAK